jgi:hypothetical protein
MPTPLPLKPASRIADALNGMLSAASSISSAARHGDAYIPAKGPCILFLEQNRNIVNPNGYPVGFTACGTRSGQTPSANDGAILQDEERQVFFASLRSTVRFLRRRNFAGQWREHQEDRRTAVNLFRFLEHHHSADDAR